MRVRTCLSVLVALLGVICHPVFAQERFGGLAGTVVDTSQAPVPGVNVTATNKQTGATHVAVSGGDGAYRIADLEPGRYTVTASCRGSRRCRRTTSSSCSAGRSSSPRP